MGIAFLFSHIQYRDNWSPGGFGTIYDFHDSTYTLKFWTERQAINKTFVFYLILMKLGEVVVIHVYYNFT